MHCFYKIADFVTALFSRFALLFHLIWNSEIENGLYFLFLYVQMWFLLLNEAVRVQWFFFVSWFGLISSLIVSFLAKVQLRLTNNAKFRLPNQMLYELDYIMDVTVNPEWHFGSFFRSLQFERSNIQLESSVVCSHRSKILSY